MSGFLHLYLGHLFGDYVLQSGWIAYRKGKDRRVLFLHVILVTISHAFFILGDGITPLHFAWILILGFGHFLQDSIKISKGNDSWKWYVLDQFVHLVMIAVVSPLFGDVDFMIPDWVTARMALSIFNAYLIGILFHTVFNSGGGYKRDKLGYLIRALLPWLPGVLWMILVCSMGVFAVWRVHKRKDSVFSTIFSGLVTIIWGVIS